MLKSLVGEPGGANFGLIPASAVWISLDLSDSKRRLTIWCESLNIDIGEIRSHCAVNFFVP